MAQEQIESLRALPYRNITPGTFEIKGVVGSGAEGDSYNQFQRETVVSLLNGQWAVSQTAVGLKKSW